MHNPNYGYTNFLLQHKRNINANNLATYDIKGAKGLNQYDRKIMNMPQQIKNNKGYYKQQKQEKQYQIQRNNKSTSSTQNLSRRSYRKERSANQRHEKPVGKSQTKNYSNKVDLRFDVKDINNKKRRYYFPWESREQNFTKEEKEYYIAQNRHKYSRNLPKDKIKQRMDYHDGKLNQSANNRQARQQLDKSKDLIRKEALNVFQKNVILRDGLKLRKKQ